MESSAQRDNGMQMRSENRQILQMSGATAAWRVLIDDNCCCTVYILNRIAMQ